MNEHLDDKLRKALRPVDPGEDFTARVLARVDAEGAHEGAGSTRPSRKAPSRFVWLPLTLAASLVLAVAITHEWRARREQAGIEARNEVIKALRVTSEKLDLAYRIVNTPAPAPADDAAGA
jgi:negative regulator of sigma E activity